MLYEVMGRRSRGPAMATLLMTTLACGPAVDVDSDGGSGTSSTTNVTQTESNGSADETGMGSDQCGFDDTEIVGGGPAGPLGYPPGCSPASDPGINGYRCCSDDPAAADGLRPDYEGLNISDADTPYFSGNNNDLSTSGQCIRVVDLAGQGLQEATAQDCPIPCNPTWDPTWITEVCGPARSCCQTRELQPEDCIMDTASGLWRPVTGEDIIAGLTAWRPADHATHQDPNGVGCLALAEDDNQSPVFQDCVVQLNVADQRGFCMALNAGQVCPHEQPDYLDACEVLNGG